MVFKKMYIEGKVEKKPSNSVELEGWPLVWHACMCVKDELSMIYSSDRVSFCVVVYSSTNVNFVF